MAYLGIIEDKNFKGLYYFSSLAMRDEIGKKFNKSSFYYDKEKDKALTEMGISESEIKDGRILMDYFRNKDEDAYLGIMGTPFDGVYCFKRKAVRDREAQNFENTYMSMDKTEILEKFGLGESEIRDGGFLMSGEVKDWLKKPKKKSAPEKKNEDVKEDKSTNPVKDDEKIPTSDKNILRNMINVVAQDNDIVEITMYNGEVYRVALRAIFYTANDDVNFANTAVSDGAGNPIIKEKMIDTLVEKKDIIVLPASKIKYCDGFAILRNCDDPYSPTVIRNDDKTHSIFHHIPEIVINTSLVTSVKGYNTYEEITLTKITKEKQKLVYDYLASKYGKK